MKFHLPSARSRSHNFNWFGVIFSPSQSAIGMTDKKIHGSINDFSLESARFGAQSATSLCIIPACVNRQELNCPGISDARREPNLFFRCCLLGQKLRDFFPLRRRREPTDDKQADQ